MIRNIFTLFLAAIFPVFAEEIHQFAGKHFLASYMDCDPAALTDLAGLQEAMDKAVSASGATIVDHRSYTFPPYGLTSLYLLSESHASIHTYPEFGSCFVDLFTCGNGCSAENFDAALRSYLKPREVNARFFLRDQTITEISYACPQQ